MDPLSLTASIAGLIGLAAQIVSVGYAVTTKMSRNADDLRALVNETAAFSGILLGVKAHLGSRPEFFADPVVMEKMLEDSKKTLDEINGVLEKLSTASRVMRVVAGDAREERVEKLSRRIEQYKSFFILCFQFETSSESETMRRKMAEIMDKIESFDVGQKKIEKAVEVLIDTEQEKRREKLVDWLGPVTETEHEDLCKRRDSESANWILDKQEYGLWLTSESSSFFWLNGIQGSGKSVIVSRIIAAIQETHMDSKDNALAYHYCRFSNSPSLDPGHLLGSFIAQLLRQSSDPALMEPIDKLYKQHQKASTRPDFNVLQTILMQMAPYFEKLFFIVDGLDEMPEDDRLLILDFLETLSQADGDFKVLVASRAEMDLEDAFSFYCTMTITPRDIAPDIERFVRKKLTRGRFRGQEVEEIVRELVARADGMFLWVICQLDHLAHVRTRITPSLLQALPRNLERTFEQTFIRLREEDRILAKRILQFVMLSGTPLDLNEVVEGIAITSETPSLAHVERNKVTNPGEIFEICGSLIRTSKSTGKIELAHYSVYRFLKSRLLEGDRVNILYIDETAGNSELLLACTRYLKMDDVSAAGVPEVEEALYDDAYLMPGAFANTPFLEHAVGNWPRYISRLPRERLQALWLPELLEFFQPGSGHFDFWARTARYIYGQHKYPRGMSPLHAAALHNLQHLVPILMTEESLQAAPWQPLDTTVGFRTPLHVAIESGKEAMVAIFMLPSYTKSTDENGRTPLHIAMECSDDLAITQLIAAGVDVNWAEKDGRTPIFIAIENAWEDLAEQLSKIADPNVTMPDGRGLMHLMAQAGSTVWASALLKHHQSLLDDTDQRGWTPLLYAIDKGFRGVAKMLLEQGAHVAVREENGWTPLHAAIRHQFLGCAEELLTSSNSKRPIETEYSRRRPRMDNLSAQERTLMQIKYGEESTSARRDRQANAGGSSSESLGLPSPILLAVSDGFLAGVELLLKHADRYSRSEIGLVRDGHTCVEKALALPDKKILELLLEAVGMPHVLKALPVVVAQKDEHEAIKDCLRRAFSAKDVYDWLLLGALMAHDDVHLGVVNYLLDLWPPLSSDFSKTTCRPLHLAAQRPPKEGSQLAIRLIQGGADGFSSDGNGLTPLHLAIQNNNWEVAQVFTTRGMVDTGAEQNLLHTLFEDARLEDGHEEDAEKMLAVAAELVASGIDIDNLDDMGRTVCHRAAARADDTLLKWALENGAFPAIADSNESTPVHLATAFGRLNNLDHLLQAILSTVPEELMRILASAGARKPPLVMAVGLERTSILSKLIEAEAVAAELMDKDEAYNDARLAAFTEALCDAIPRRFGDGISLLMAAMDNNISGHNAAGDTPLHVAVREKDEAVVRMLLSHGAQTRVQHVRTGKTPYDVAVAGGMTGIMELLSQHGAEYQAEDIVAAAKSGNMVLLQNVLSRYPDDAEGQMQALFTARNHRKVDVVNRLLGHVSGSQPPWIDGIPRDAYGDTALHQAVRIQDLERLQSLVSACDGALLHAKDVGGDSALMLSIRNCHWSSAEMLAEARADVGEALGWATVEKCDVWIDKLTDLQARFPSAS